MRDKLTEMFKKSSFSISREVYYYCRVSDYPSEPNEHFMISDDGEEITVVTQNDSVDNLVEKNKNEWLLVSLNLDIPFMKGTLLNVSKAIYGADTNILIVSTYSKDLLFIKKQDKERVKKALKKLGFEYLRS